MKTVSRVVSTAVMLVVTALICALAKNLPVFFFSYWEPASQQVLGILNQAFGWVPFPVWEALAALLIVWIVASLLHAIFKLRLLRWLSGALWGASLAVLLFVLLWGVGHFAPEKTSRIVTADKPSLTQLRDAALWYGERASAAADKVARENGAMHAPDFDTLSAEANTAFAALSQTYGLPAADVAIKPLFGGELFSYLGLTGLFAPYTAEPTVNPDTYAPSLPYTACHELAHRLGAYAEQDANFLAYLACVQSQNDAVRYSGEYSAFLYCYNALFDLSQTDALSVWDTLGENLKHDLLHATEHYAAYEGTVKNAAQNVNDLYLKAFEESGIDSYDQVAEALVAWQIANR